MVPGDGGERVSDDINIGDGTVRNGQIHVDGVLADRPILALDRISAGRRRRRYPAGAPPFPPSEPSDAPPSPALLGGARSLSSPNPPTARNSRRTRRPSARLWVRRIQPTGWRSPPDRPPVMPIARPLNATAFRSISHILSVRRHTVTAESSSRRCPPARFGLSAPGRRTYSTCTHAPVFAALVGSANAIAVSPVCAPSTCAPVDAGRPPAASYASRAVSSFHRSPTSTP